MGHFSKTGADVALPQVLDLGVGPTDPACGWGAAFLELSSYDVDVDLNGRIVLGGSPSIAPAADAVVAGRCGVRRFDRQRRYRLATDCQSR